MKQLTFPLVIGFLLINLYSCKKDVDDPGGMTVKDYDGNVYETVQIGEQVWMATSLKTTHYADGSTIPLIEDDASWPEAGPAMCFYDHSTANGDTYGALYSWSAAMNGDPSSEANPSGVQGVCPDGWHLPSDAEWKELEVFLGMAQVDADMPGFRGTDEGSKLAGNPSLWMEEALVRDPAFGSSGFNALPAGYRFRSGSFSHLGIGADFWSATASGEIYAWSRFLFCYNTDIHRFTEDRNNGFSVRCVQD